jgi:hypothetical protein
LRVTHELGLIILHAVFETFVIIIFQLGQLFVVIA